ncbi:MAG: F0F1 ATP synthase subunit B [Parcubacteria group bacterium]|jgi:F-type H+-transporting ATPase subunit b
MDELIKTFHIDTNLLIAQLVNFTIVLVVLYKFAYGPILRTLNERTSKIEKGLKDSEESGKKLAEIMEKEKEVMTEARKEAQVIIAKAEEQAKKSKEEIAGEAKAQAEKIMTDATKKIEEEKNKMFAEVKGEIANLVVLATEKVLSEKIDSVKDKELINNIIK